MDFDSLVEDKSQGSAKPAAEAPPSFDSLPHDFDGLAEDDAEKPELSTGESLLGGVEAVAHGAAGPIATAAESGLSQLGVPNLTAEDRERRKEGMNPWVHGGLEAAGFIAPALLSGGMSAGARAALEAGEIGLDAAKGTSQVAKAVSYLPSAMIDRAGAATAKSLGYGKLGSAVMRGLVEGGLIGAGDAASDIIDGKNDPEAPVSSAIAHIGGATLLGAGAGGLTGGLLDVGTASAAKGLRALADSRAGNGAAKLIQDFGNRWHWGEANVGTAEAVTDELTALHQTVSHASDVLRGASGLKSQAIDALSKEVAPEALASHVGEVANVLDKTKSLEGYAPFSDAIEEWKSKVSPAQDAANMFAAPKQPSAADVFRATEELKRKVADIVYGPGVTTKSEIPVMSALEKVRKSLQGSLEDTSVWGKLGDLQSDVNKATHEFLPSLENFNSAGARKIVADNGSKIKIVDPDKIANLVKSFGKDKKSIQKSFVGSFLDKSKSYIDEVNGLYQALGIEGSIPGVSTNETEHLLHGTLPWGAKLADMVRETGASSFANKVASTVGGMEVGAKVGGWPGAAIGGLTGRLLPWLEGAIGRPIKEYAIPGVLRALGSGKPEAVIAALEHADNVYKGQKTMESVVNGLFSGTKISSIKTADHMEKEKEKEHIRKYVDKGVLEDQISSLSHGVSAQALPPGSQSFATGGEVQAQEQKPSPEPTEATNNHGSGKLAAVYPNQAMLMMSAKGRVYNYLNSVKPQKNAPKLPFDEETKDPVAEKRYDKALSIAADPLAIMNRVQAGTLEPDDVKHMAQMWPEVHGQLSKKMTQKMMEAHLKGDKKPPYKVRQAMSLFMGSALESTMTPAAIQAAQGTFMNKPQPQQAPSNKKGTSTLSKVPGNYMTPEQARQARQNKV